MSPRTENAAPLRRDRLLEGALLATFVLHGLAMIGMIALLMPMLPGGGVASDAERVALIAMHPWRFRLGWFPWQLTAASDVVLGVALLRARWVPKLPAIVAFVLTMCAFVPDQGAQLVWETFGITMARAAIASGDLASYLDFERVIFASTAAVGAAFYTLGGVAWCWCFVRAGTWSRALTWLSVPLYAIFFAVSIGPLLPLPARPSPAVIAAGNAIGFVMLELWFALVAEAVLRRARPTRTSGRDAPWRHPWRGFVGRAFDLIAESRFLRALCEVLPVIAFKSDIREVIYVNYVVAADRLESLVPEGLELQRLGDDGGHALFTFLSYRHGGFGPRALGALRRLLPSPMQTNWRIHVRDPRTGREGITFVTSAISATVHALGARLMTAGMPMHVLANADIRRNPDGGIHLALDPGAGSAPDATATLRPEKRDAPMPATFSACWPSFDAFLAYAVPQDRAMSTEPWRPRVVRQEIDLGIAFAVCERLNGEVISRAAIGIVGADAVPVCFRVPEVAFEFTTEAYDLPE